MIGGDNSLSILREESSVIVWRVGGRDEEEQGERDTDPVEAKLTLSCDFTSPKCDAQRKYPPHVITNSLLLD